VVVLVVLMVFGVAALQAWVGQDGLHAAALERELQHEQERLTLLRARVAQLSSPHRLRTEAEKLGLTPDPDPTYLRAPFPASPNTLFDERTAMARSRLPFRGLTTPTP
jgi:hypothetical protein